MICLPRGGDELFRLDDVVSALLLLLALSNRIAAGNQMLLHVSRFIRLRQFLHDTIKRFRTSAR